jgi:soluble lytic murein transglycosylase-like protein
MGEIIPRRIKRTLLSVMMLPVLIAPNIAGTTVTYVAPIVESEPMTVESSITFYAEEYGVDEQLARDIIYCESRFLEDARNYDAVVGEDVGLFQLNSYYWQYVMAEKGWDIYNTKDNIEAGMWLLSVEGSTPWNWSKFCWSKR